MSIIRAIAFDSQVQEVGEGTATYFTNLPPTGVGCGLLFLPNSTSVSKLFLSSCPKLAWGFLQRESVPS